MSVATAQTATRIPDDFPRKEPSRVDESVTDDEPSAARLTYGSPAIPEAKLQAMRSDDAMAGVVIGGILTLAFSVLIAAMLVVICWTIYAIK